MLLFYVMSLENWLEMLLILAIFTPCSGLEYSIEIHHFSQLTLLLWWVEFLLMSRQLPLLSVKLEIVKRVILTFLSFMVVMFSC